MSEIAIRSARPSDIERLAELGLLLQRHVEASNPVIWRITEEGSDRLKRELELALDGNGERVIVAEVGGKVVGFAHGQALRRADYLPGSVGKVNRVYVQKGYRSRGIGKRLVKGLCRFFRQEGVEEVTVRYAVGNEEAEGFWKGLGFKPVIIAANTRLEELERRLTPKEDAGR